MIKNYYFIAKISLRMKDIENSTLYDCKPWETGALLDNTNLLTNFKQNLCCYEQGYRKFTIKSRCVLPQIENCIKTKTIVSQGKLNDSEGMGTINKSV
jgi:hypothetical protein